jgi:hypothetical protein
MPQPAAMNDSSGPSYAIARTKFGPAWTDSSASTVSINW